jgi:pantoate--beta-alanine ligase
MMQEMKHPLAFVPTMGALHAGHQSLITLAKSYAPHVAVSIFVNPLQFENPDDLAKYPRDVAGDTEKAKSVGADYVWAPTVEEMYPAEPTIIPAGAIGNMYEGIRRTGHFDGVLTVVKRLFDLVQPDVAVFGEKDFQQLFLIRKLVHDLNLPITIVGAPLVRETDGLAMSSRNVRLDEAGRRSSLVISQALREAALVSGFTHQRAVLHSVLSSEPGFTVDYAEIIDESNFELATPQTPAARAIIAGWVNGVRLLDNMPMQVANS